MKFTLVWLLLFLTTTLPRIQPLGPTMEKLVSFPYIDFWFHTWDLHEQYIQQQIYKQVIPHTIKLYRNQIYVSFPRKSLSSNIPITLGKMLTKYDFLSPVLETRFVPFPSWERNTISSQQLKNETIYSVLGFEIDTQTGVMYILDQGQPSNPGTMKIIRYDLEADVLLDSLVFSKEHGVDETKSSLDQIVVDPLKNRAFVSDSGTLSLFMVDFSTKQVRKIVNGPSTTPDSSLWISYQNNKKCLTEQSYQVGIYSLALSCDFQRLYYSPLTSKSLYQISTQQFDTWNSSLQNTSPPTTIVVPLGDKKSIAPSMLCNTLGELLISDVETNQIFFLDEMLALQQHNVSQLLQSFFPQPQSPLLQWPSSMSYGTNGYFYVLTNQFCNYLNNEMDFKNPNNFIIWRGISPSRNYIDGCNQVRGDRFMQSVAIAFLIVITVVGILVLVLTLIQFAPHMHFYLPFERRKNPEDTLNL